MNQKLNPAFVSAQPTADEIQADMERQARYDLYRAKLAALQVHLQKEGVPSANSEQAAKINELFDVIVL